MKKIKKDEKEEENLKYNNVVIHLDLVGSEETSFINEFLFSFLLLNFILTIMKLFTFQII